MNHLLSPPKSRFNVLLALALALALALVLAACESEDLIVEEPIGEEPKQILWDFSSSERDSGRLSWELSGQKALFYESEPQLRATGVRLRIYDTQGQESSFLVADSAFLNRRSGKGDMRARGNVYVLSSDSTEMWTSELLWSEKERIFSSDSFVKVRDGRDLHSGYRVSCDERLGRLWIDSLPRHEVVTEEGVLP